MKIIDREYIDSNKEEILNAIKEGKIFIYPTDTIYGLGTNALLDNSVKKIREIKRRDEKPFSVIAPSKEWILENCKLKIETLEKYLPGPYTLIAESQERNLAPSVNPTNTTVGVRVPQHWFTEVVNEAGVPFVTTSVNISGDKFMERLEDVPEEILDQVDYVVYEGEKRGEPSIKVNLL